MAEFSITDAAFAGFRFVREHPRAAVIWALLQLVVGLGAGLLMTMIAGPALMELQAMSRSADPSRVMALFGQVAPLYLILLVLGAVVYAVLYGAASRAILRPGEPRMGYLRLGGDELRQFLLILLFSVVAFAAYIAAIIVVAIPTVAVTVASKTAGPLVGVLVFLAVACVLVFFWVRLSLASPLTFQERRVDLFGSWDLTRGRFWPLFGTYLLVFVLAVLVGLLCFILAAVLTALLGGGLRGVAQMMRPDMSSVGAYLSPARLVLMVVWSAASGLIWPLVLLPPAEIYRQLKGPDDPAVAF